MYIYKAGVVGGGTMGAGIAQVITFSGLPVIIKEINQEAVDKAIANIRKIYQSRVEKGKMTSTEMEQKMMLVQGTTNLSDFNDVDIVIEAIPEVMDLKKKLFSELDNICPSSAIFASNTSALSISEMALVTKRPHKFIGMHFFNPANVMKLVEVIPGKQTSEETVNDILSFAESLRKIPIKVKECAGFLVNRLLMPYLNEAFYALQEGADPKLLDEKIVQFGMPMGPFTLADMLGLDIAANVGETLYQAYGERMKPAVIINRLVSAGRLGTKKGKGIYDYTEPPTNELKDIVTQIQKETNLSGTEFSVERLIYALLNEAILAFQEGIAGITDIEMGMIAGTGFPQDKSGPLHYADSLGLDVLMKKLEELEKIHGPRFSPAPILQRYVMKKKLGVKTKQGFFEYQTIEASNSGIPTYKFVNLTVEEKIAIITINNPPANALSTALMEELNSVIDTLDKNDELKAIIITGAGNIFFVAGADIKEIKNIDSKEKGHSLASRGQEIISKIENLTKPVIAAINGICLGGGNELAMACHIRIASDMAKFGQPEINLGIIPGFGGTQRLSRIVGKSRAMEICLTGDMITAKEAEKIGLVNKIVPPNEVLKHAKGLAKKIIAKGKISIAKIIESIQQGMEVSLPEGLKIEAINFGKICETDDMKEGLSAFTEKRQPKFKDK